MNKHRFFVGLLLCTGLGWAAPASAVPTRWSFSETQFYDGSLIEGSFFHDAGRFFNWDIRTFRGPGMVFGDVTDYHYTETSANLVADPSGITLNRLGLRPDNFLQLSLGPLPVAGWAEASALERSTSGGGYSTSRSVSNIRIHGVASPVPEASTTVLLGLGLLAVAARVRQRRVAADRGAH
jgi:hypothetical protein